MIVVALVAALAGMGVPRTVLAQGPGPWVYGTDLIAQAAPAGTNGGAAANGFYSAVNEVQEECITASTCGRGEAGGHEPFGAVVLNNLDAANSGVTFACPDPVTGLPAAGTTTGKSGTNLPPAVSLFPGTDAGGSASSGGIKDDNQCYSPYVKCNAATGPNTQCSAALGSSSNIIGNAYPARPLTVGRQRNTAWYVRPQINGKNTNSACSGHVLVAGGDVLNGGGQQQVDNTAELYDPRATVGGLPNLNFNKWTALPAHTLAPPSNFPTMSNGHDTAAIVNLADGRVLIAGGEQDIAGGPSPHYELFDPFGNALTGAGACQFVPIPHGSMMTIGRYEFGMAMFGDGKVLACGGATFSGSFTAPTNTCELFDPGAGSLDIVTGKKIGVWTAVGNLSVLRDRNVAKAVGSNTIVQIGGTSGALTDVSEECTEDTPTTVSCGHNQQTYPTDPRIGTATTAPRGASAVLLGAETPGSTTPLAGLILECGGFSFDTSGNRFGIPPPRTCEYYVPSTHGALTSDLGSCASGSAGPEWCASSSFDMQRERAFFSLQEVPPCGTGCPTGDTQSGRVIVAGGFYGVGSGSELVRKNVEYLNIGTGGTGATGGGGTCGGPCASLAIGDNPADANEEWGATLSASGLQPSTTYQVRYHYADGSELVTNSNVTSDSIGGLATFVDIDDTGPATPPASGSWVHIYLGGTCVTTAGLTAVNAFNDTPQSPGSPVPAKDPSGGIRQLPIRLGDHRGDANSHRGYGQQHVTISRGQLFSSGSVLWNKMLDIVRNNTPIWERGVVGGVLKWTAPDGWYVTSDEQSISATDGLSRGLITVSPPLP